MTAVTDPITVVLADDHRVVRAGLRMLLESDPRFAVVGESGTVADTEQTVAALTPAVLVLDLNLGGESGLEAIPRLRAQRPQTQIVVLTMQEDPGFARAALAAGALAYVLKDGADEDLLTAVTRAARGEGHLPPALAQRLATPPPESVTSRPGNLSSREIEVLRLIGLGHTNGEIAETLSLSVRTVESHRAHINQKINVGSRAGLVAYAQEHGLLD